MTLNRFKMQPVQTLPFVPHLRRFQNSINWVLRGAPKMPPCEEGVDALCSTTVWVPRGGGRARSLYATPPQPPRVLKDSGAGSATNKCL